MNKESCFIGSKDRKIYFQTWSSEEKPKALIVILHGLGEHSGRYAQVASFFNQHHFAVAALDHNSHGKSDGNYGDIERFSDFIDDVKMFCDLISKEYSGIPLVMLGHSMGGLIGSYYLTLHQNEFACAVLTGAAIKPINEPGLIEKKIFQLLFAIAPKLRLLKLDANLISRDPNVVNTYQEDPLVNHTKLTVRLVNELFTAMEYVQENAQKISLPILVMHGTDDQLAPPSASEFLIDHVSSEQKVLKLYPGLYHEILNEPERDQVLDDIVQWVEQQL